MLTVYPRYASSMGKPFPAEGLGSWNWAQAGGVEGAVVTEEGCRLFENRSSVVPGLGWDLAGSQVRLVAWGVGVGRGLNSAWAWGVDSAPAPSSALLYFRRQHRKWAFTMSGYRKLSNY